MLITQIQYLGIVLTLPLTLLFVLKLFDMEYIITPMRTGILFSISAIIALLVWTNPFHQLYYTEAYVIDTGPFPMLGLEHGPFFWAHILYHYMMLFALTIYLIWQITSSARYYRGQAGVILIAVISVWLANIIYISGLSPIPNMDTSSIAFVLVAASLAWGFLRYHLLDIMPVAKTTIFNSLTDGIVVLDIRNRIVDINSAARTLLHSSISDPIGMEIETVFFDFPEFLEYYKYFQPVTVIRRVDNCDKMYRLRFSELKVKNGTRVGRLILLRDISLRRDMDEALRGLTYKSSPKHFEKNV